MGRTRGPLEDVRELETAVNLVTGCLNEAFLKACPERVPPRGIRQSWWPPELKVLRRESRKLLNKAKRENTAEGWDEYRDALGKFKKETRKAKSSSWAQFCGELASWWRNVISKDPITPSSLRREDGTYTESGQETVELSMEAHILGGQEEVGDQNIAIPTHVALTDDLIRDILDEEKIARAGPNGIIPGLVQESLGVTLPWLERIFRASLAWVILDINFWKKFGLILDIQGSFVLMTGENISTDIQAVSPEGGVLQDESY
ncbi:uncharacterized protein LOC131996026 [Stomoxys calcitrans]|uniref:uncharacterized protein LOC131996026 n=1 Tax=Stomoxys calcitrans TaxID=35570 RepID=UPI0027E28E29|nr:uncharacterized protein LOC131996026 [Stomoxys calcitrans]